MAKTFNELVKEFNLIRPYTRDFFINGFKHRDDFQERSSRSYDNERRRIESYLAHFVEWEQTPEGKTLHLNLKSEAIDSNPFFRVWQAKSFTKNDIFLHFIILDCLMTQNSLSLTELVTLIHEDYLFQFDIPSSLSHITVRNKLKEYCQLGIISEVEENMRLTYELAPLIALDEQWTPVLQFYKEVFPVGIIGQFLLNQLDIETNSPFSFKHHFIVHTLDDEITLAILTAISEECYISLEQYSGNKTNLVPLSFYSSTETGRQYLIGYLNHKLLTSVRIDFIKNCKIGIKVDDYEEIKQLYLSQKDTSWNGSFNQQRLKKTRVTLRIEEFEENHLLERLKKEQRMGKSKRIDKNTVIFEIELDDLYAINPFLRTFIGRIISIESNDTKWRKLFIQDMFDLIALYKSGEED